MGIVSDTVDSQIKTRLYNMRTQPEPTAGTLECGCSGQPRPSLEHNLTCPHKAEFILASVEVRGIEWFTGWYDGDATLPNSGSGVSPEMMQCDCGHWFPRWQYYRCPKCGAGH